MSTLQVEYIGSKPVKEDNVAHTGVVWVGQGDVQEVPASAWAKLSRHPDVWCLAGEGQPLIGTALVSGEIKSAQVPDGSPTPEDVKPPDTTKEPVQSPPEEVLYGTDHPALIEIGGEQLQLGDVVNAAFSSTGMSVGDWNALDDQDRFDFVESHIMQLRAEAASKAVAQDSQQTEAKPAVKAARGAKTGRGAKKGS